MKKKALLYALLLVASACQLTSCDIYINDDYIEDSRRAYTITGQWRGKLGMFYSITNPYTGRISTFDSDDSYIVFYNQGATYGTGKQIDHYSEGPLRERYHFFNWEIRNGVLYLDFPSDSNLNTAIYDYSLFADRFIGRIGNTHFQLYSLDYNYWDRYTGDDYDYYNDAWLWSR